MRGKLALLPALPALAALLAPPAAPAATPKPRGEPAPRRHASPPPKRQAAAPAKRLVKIVKVRYRAHDGSRRRAYLLLPAWYGPRRNPPIPLVISPHGRGGNARANARLWGALPGRGGFAVISPEGTGRRLDRYSWGSAGQVADLARMPQIAVRTVPWLRIHRRRVYAFGGSMGGQEVLLLLARHPGLLAGVAAFDAVTDFARQYRSFPRIPCGAGCKRTWNGPIGVGLQSLARRETGGTPRTRRRAYELRSPLTYARAIAGSCVPLQLWWSLSDRIVVDQPRQTGALFRRIRQLNPRAPVQAYVGHWAHSYEMRAKTRLPLAVAAFGLLHEHPRSLARGMRIVPAPAPARRCGGRAATTVLREPGHPPR